MAVATDLVTHMLQPFSHSAVEQILGGGALGQQVGGDELLEALMQQHAREAVAGDGMQQQQQQAGVSGSSGITGLGGATVSDLR